MSELGNYLIGSQTIGQGTFGKVCLAKHKLLGYDAAVKILEKKKIQDDLDLERVKREITILQMLSHPNVVQLYEMTETETHLYLFMEYAEGGELYEYIDKKKRISEMEACKFMHQIISAIQYIHSLHIVHRDLKPENLLLTAEKNILVVDFGLSNTYEDTLKTACGSPCYAAPEMIQGKPYHGLQTDIWSCGVIMYAMLCGYLPFEDSNTQVLYKKILTADFHIPRYVSIDGKDLIKNILTVDPTKRYTIEQIRQHKWWQLWKSDSLQLSSNHKAINKIQCNLLPNSIFSKCLKKNIERNVSEDKTCCDTVQESIEFHLNDFMNKSNLKIEEQTENNQFEFSQKQDVFTQSPKAQDDEPLIVEAQDEYEFQQSIRSLTRQKSSQSIQSIKHLQTQIDSPQKPITLHPVKQNNIVNKIIKPTVKRPSVPVSQPQQGVSSKKPVTKTGPSKSLHEPPQFDIKFLKHPQTPSVKQTNATNNTNNTTIQQQLASHSLKTEIPKKNSIPPVKLGVIQEQLKENKEKSHSLKTQPNSYKQQQQNSQVQQQKGKEKLETEISNFDQRQSINLTSQQAAKIITNQFKTPSKQQQPQISATKRSFHQKQAASVQIDRQSFHTQASVIEDSNQFTTENTKSMVEKFMIRLNNVKITQMSQNKKQQDQKGIENLLTPFSLSFITAKHPQLFMKEIQKYLIEKYQTSKNSMQCNGSFQFNCQINEIQLDFKLLRIENSEVYYCSITQQPQNNFQNQEELYQIIQDLQYYIKF